MADPGKSVLIILLVIIGIGMVLYFLVNNINIPPAEWAPFVDGTKVRVRSLITNQYMVPASSLVENQPIEGSKLVFRGSGGAITVWQLCQDAKTTSDQRGRYVLFWISDESPGGTYIDGGPRDGPVVGVDRFVTCPALKEEPSDTSNKLGVYFQLVEDGTSSLYGGVASNVYNIINNDQLYLSYDPIISEGFSAGVASWIKEPGNPADIRWSFAIETVNSG